MKNLKKWWIDSPIYLKIIIILVVGLPILGSIIGILLNFLVFGIKLVFLIVIILGLVWIALKLIEEINKG